MLKELTYTLIESRVLKYGSYNIDNIKNSVYYYAKVLNLTLDLSTLTDIIKDYKPGIEFKRIKIEELKTKKEDSFILPEGSILRYAACPNLSPTLFNLKGLALCKIFQIKNSKIKIYMRFDDTNPDKKSASYQTYRSYMNAIRWLGLNVEYIYVSNRLNRYYEVAKSMFDEGFAYLDWGYKISKSSEDFEKFLKSVKGFTKCVLRHKKGWVLLRYVIKKHVYVRNRHVWPTYNFHSPIDEVDFGITHIYRGKDLLPSEIYQKDIYSYIGEPNIIKKYWGRNRLKNYSVHSSSLRNNKKLYSPDYIVFQNLQYYHISAYAILNFFKEIGLSNTDTIVNLGILKKYQTKLDCFNYCPVPLYLVKFIEHISLIKGHIYVDTQYKKFKKNMIFKCNGSFYKINPYRQLIKLIM